MIGRELPRRQGHDWADEAAEPKRWRFIVDIERCEGCNNCFVACKDEHVGNQWPGYTASAALHGTSWIQVPRCERGRYPTVDITYKPTPCYHCDDAPCVPASGGAITRRRDGIVMIDPQKAKGRPDLVDTCPFGAISWNEEANAAQKCTLCAHLLDDGWTKSRCVQACGPGSLSMMYVDDFEMARIEREDELVNMDDAAPGKAVVYYKNYHRYGSSFIAGAVGLQVGEVVDCAADVTVELRRGSGDGELVASQQTDPFGEYRFDGLENESGQYTVVIADGSGRQQLPVVLGETTVLDLVMLGAERK